MAIILQLVDPAGNTRTIEANPGDTVVLRPGEGIENVAGVDLSQVQLRIEAGTLFIDWPEGGISIPGYAQNVAEAENANNSSTNETDSAAPESSVPSSAPRAEAGQGGGGQGGGGYGQAGFPGAGRQVGEYPAR